MNIYGGLPRGQSVGGGREQEKILKVKRIKVLYLCLYEDATVNQQALFERGGRDEWESGSIKEQIGTFRVHCHIYEIVPVKSPHIINIKQFENKIK
jgi:hypothetical protein